jgi:hypothetical protein
MNREFIIKLIEEGHEIEFEYKDKRYSITYGYIDNIPVISFCEFNNESKEVEDIDSLLEMNYKGQIVGDIIDSLSEDDVWIF